LNRNKKEPHVSSNKTTETLKQIFEESSQSRPTFVPLSGCISSNFFPALSKLQAESFEMQFNPEF
jgi:hypothetical protein